MGKSKAVDHIAAALACVDSDRYKNGTQTWITALPEESRNAIEEIFDAYVAGTFGANSSSSLARHIIDTYKVTVSHSTVRRYLRSRLAGESHAT